MSTTPGMTNVFQFMELRAPFSPDSKALRQKYIRDDVVVSRGENQDGVPKSARIDADLQSPASASTIGRLVYEQVFCTPDSVDFTEVDRTQNLLNAILGLLGPYQPQCPMPSYFADNATPLSIAELERRTYVVEEDLYYLLPERLDQIEGLSLSLEIQRALAVMERSRPQFDSLQLIKELVAVCDGRPLPEIVFQNGAYTVEFREAKRRLFDSLYLLYIMRRRTSVNLEHVIDGLRVLHVIEALAIDSVIESMKTAPLSASERALLVGLFPELYRWNGLDLPPAFPLIQAKADFDAYFSATPVIHPIFARLHRYRRPFNDIKPIGIGDLKVVKQWLVEYLPGEISYIENVLKGEFKTRTHRRLEKTEESFSFSSDSKESSQKDTQTTDRFELKSEVENVMKNELSAGVNTSVSSTYNYPGGLFTISGNIGANLSYKRDTSDQSKVSSTLAREVVSKAIEQVEKNVVSTRSTTMLFETEETNVHGFENRNPGAAHISGIYRWLDKKYKAQLFNYGKHMMFEFVIPEPAAFFVESRLAEFQATLECPQPPSGPFLKPLSLKTSKGLPLTPALIDEDEFQKLKQKYGSLSELSFPARNQKVGFIDPATGNNYFEKNGTSADNDNWSAETYHCKLNVAGYNLTSMEIEGILGFADTGTPSAPDTGSGQSQNTLVLYVNGTEVFRDQNLTTFKQYTGGFFQVPPPSAFAEDVDLTIGLWDRSYFRLTINAQLGLSSAALLKWQTTVFGVVRDIEQKQLDKDNQEVQLAYDVAMITYRNRLDELKQASVKDLLQGQSEAFNREFIRTELKKHCLTMLTKEFSADHSNDLIGLIDPVQRDPGDFTFHQFKVTENAATNTTSGSFAVQDPSIDYPSIVLEQAKIKGRFIQFLEQAFEWQQLGYSFYPYFWATRPKWIDMMNRSDDTDPNMSAFLQAGSVKVLIAVTTAYEEAVLHFLATREPWDGGPAPVIGDPLFIPLYEELHKRQDDLYNATPEGEPWTFTLPTSLVYLDDSGATLPTFPDVPS